MVTALKTDEIRKMIYDRYYWDTRVEYANIAVEVHEGKVTLIGSVPNAPARIAAGKTAANVPGVLSVDNRLKIRFTGDIPIPSDAEIESRITQVINWNSNIDAGKIAVSANAGDVTLSGTVHSYYQKIRAEELAGDIIGVLKVDNRLAVVPTTSSTDEAVASDIVAAVKNALGRDADRMTVMVKDGIVTLTGYAPDRLALNATVNIVRHVRGVVDVNNLLLVGEPA